MRTFATVSLLVCLAACGTTRLSSNSYEDGGADDAHEAFDADSFEDSGVDAFREDADFADADVSADASTIDADVVDMNVVDAATFDAARPDAASADAASADAGPIEIVVPPAGIVTSEPQISQFGDSVALSPDGNLLAVGDPSYGDSATFRGLQGAVFLYARTGGRFVSPAVKVIVSPNVGDGFAFGSAVAFSPDGNTLAVGELYGGGTPSAIEGPGRVYFFAKSGASYASTPTQTLTGPSVRSRFGGSLCFSGDGNAIAIGTPELNQVRIHTRSGAMFMTTATQILAAPSGSSYFGGSVAYSSDDDTLIVGDVSYGLPTRLGAVHVFARSGGAFATTPTQTLSAPPGARDFGWSVSLSFDGNTLVVGDPSAYVLSGSRTHVHVFTRSSGSFSATASATLTDVDGTSKFGAGVALSRDGNTLVVGDNGDEGAGGAFVFTRSSGSFSSTPAQVVRELWRSATFGSSASLAPDGSYLVVGNTQYGTTGGVHVYARSGSSFSDGPSQTLVGPSGSFGFGAAVAITPDGNTLIVGDQNFGATFSGAVHLFARSGGRFAETPARTLLPPSTATNFRFGAAVAISPDGNTLAVGDPEAGFMSIRRGAVSIYTRGDSGFMGPPSAGLSALTDSNDFGASLAFSADGRTLAVGDPNHGSSRAGIVHLYARSGSAFEVTAGRTLAAPAGSKDFGTSLAFSPGGTGFVVGDPNDGTSSLGSVRLYNVSSSGVSTTASQTVVGPAETFDFGASLAFSRDGLRLFAGDSGYGTELGLSGAVHVYSVE